MGKSKKVKGTKQTLEFKEREEKFHVRPIKCRSQKQKQFLKVLENNQITICIGPAGTSKTYTAVYNALKALEKKQVEQIILIKPNIDIPGYELGFLPGDYQEKLDPYLYSYYDQIDKIIGEKFRVQLIKEGKIKVVPIALLRGRTFENSYCIIDEIQNCNYDAFKTIITRIGEGSIYNLMGDIGQIDFKKKSDSALKKILDLFKDDPEIGTFEFTEEDVVRHPLITHILHKLKTIENT